jgi:hypothetical protein
MIGLLNACHPNAVDILALPGMIPSLEIKRTFIAVIPSETGDPASDSTAAIASSV